MAVPFSNTKLRVPHGFQILLEGVAKEVLQMQPNDIFAFSAVYFENLLQLRETGVLDPVAQMSTTQDRMYNNKAFQKPDVDVNNDEQQDAAVKIQTKYRQHQSKAVVDQMRQDKAATRIQAGIRGHLGRKRVANLRKEVASSSQRSSNAEDGNDLEELAQEDEFNINEEEEETARTPQGSIDPEMTTRSTALPATPSEPVQPFGKETEEIDIDLGDPEVQKAAAFIQSGFRGLKSRRKPPPPPPQSSSPIPPSSPSPAIMQASSMTQIEDSLAATPSEAVHVQPGGKETEEIDIDLGDPEVQKAAAFIQSGFRGLKSRRKPSSTPPQPTPPPPSPPPPSPPPPSPPATIQTTAISELDPEETASSRSPVNDEDRGTGFDLNDPEVQLAATKIQAGFRGMHTRHQLKPPRKVKPEETASSRSSVDDEDRGTGFDLNDPEVQLAATKIQAGFRGMHTRHQLKPPRQADVSKDNVEEDLTARFEGDESTAFEEPEPEEEERERQETPTTKLEMSRGGMQGDITQEDENAEVEFSEDDPEMIKAIEEIQAGFSRLKAESENEHEVVESNDQENLEIDAAATKIQAGFKGMRLRKELKEKKLEKKVINEEPKEMQPEEDTDAGNLNSDAELTVAANKIQAGFRGYKTRQEVHKLRKVKGEELVSQEKMKEEHEAEENINNSDDDEKRVVAASKIQAGFKGYQTRREVEVVRRQRANDEKRVVAASKIQAGFKGYKTRREVEVVRRQRANVSEVNEEEGHEERRGDEEKQTEDAGEEREQESARQEEDDA